MPMISVERDVPMLWQRSGGPTETRQKICSALYSRSDDVTYDNTSRRSNEEDDVLQIFPKGV